MVASITKKENGSFLIRVYNGIKNGKPQSVAVTFRANPCFTRDCKTGGGKICYPI